MPPAKAPLYLLDDRHRIAERHPDVLGELEALLLPGLDDADQPYLDVRQPRLCGHRLDAAGLLDRGRIRGDDAHRAGQLGANGSLAEDQRPDSRCDELADELVERHALLGQQLLAEKNLAVEEDQLNVDVLGVVAAQHAIQGTHGRVD